MANDMDMLGDIEILKDFRHTKQAKILEKFYAHAYGLGKSPFKNKAEFEKTKKAYEKKYGFLDNYV